MIFEKSNDAKILESVLSQMAIGQRVTYDELSKAIGRDVRAFARSALQTARNRLLRDAGIVFGVEANEGLVRLNDSQIIKTTEADRKRVQRQANRTLRKLGVVKFDALSDSDKMKHTVAAAQAGAIVLFSKSTTTKKLESKVQTPSDSLPIGETLKLFS